MTGGNGMRIDTALGLLVETARTSALSTAPSAVVKLVSPPKSLQAAAAALPPPRATAAPASPTAAITGWVSTKAASQQPPPRPSKRRRITERNHPFFHIRLNVPKSVTTDEQRNAFTSKVRTHLDTHFVAFAVQLERGQQGGFHYQIIAKTCPKRTRAKIVQDWCRTFEHLLHHVCDDLGQRVIAPNDGTFPYNAKRADGAEWYCEPQVHTRGGVHTYRYALKPETRVAGPWRKNTTPRAKQRRSSGGVAVGAHAPQQQQPPTAASTQRVARQLVLPPKAIKVLHPSQFHMWQRKLYTELLGEPDDRTIHWLWEPNGKAGKSQFCKFLCYTHADTVLMCAGRALDMKNAIVNRYDTTHTYPAIVLFDVPRVHRGFLDFQGLEEIKNGCFASTKYQCGQVVMNSPHVIVFSNRPPTDRSLLSADRWKITRIAPDSEHETEVQQ